VVFVSVNFKHSDPLVGGEWNHLYMSHMYARDDNAKAIESIYMYHNCHFHGLSWVHLTKRCDHRDTLLAFCYIGYAEHPSGGMPDYLGKRRGTAINEPKKRENGGRGAGRGWNVASEG
jgi:hypothetical protein